MSTHILLIRHGETDWNAEGRIQGQLQVPLNGRGFAQAQALGRFLRTSPFDAVYSSDLLRARQTAEAIVRNSGDEIRYDARLREWDLGVLSGLLRSEVEQQQPFAYRIRRDYLVDEPIPGGESIRQRYERVMEAVCDMVAAHPGATLVVVSHGGPVGDCYRRALGRGVEERLKVDVFNASINRIQVEGDRWAVVSWAEMDHLASIGSLPNWEGRV